MTRFRDRSLLGGAVRLGPPLLALALAACSASPRPVVGPASAIPEEANLDEISLDETRPAPSRVAASEDLPTRAGKAPAEAEERAPDAPLTTTDIARQTSSFSVFVRSGNAYGAGILMDEAGHVVTCDHVVLDPERVEIHFEGLDTPLSARVVDRDRALDLALLELSGEPPASAVPASRSGFQTIASLERGDLVYAMGSPRKMSFSFHRGMVSFLGRQFEGLAYLQTDLPMNPGSSGGPIVDEAGRLVGLASFILRDGQGLSFALPIDYAFQRFDALSRDADRDRLRVFDEWLARRHGGETAEVSTTPAADRVR